tara:strand:+ start:2136 stop:3338 length:1203 start_codon:yes stop_codon:yes gene_type:complete
MLKNLLVSKILGLFILFMTNFSCTENNVTGDLDHLNNNIVDTTTYDISAQSYYVTPKLGDVDGLYFGRKNNLSAEISLFKMPNSNVWKMHYDSTFLIDSIFFDIQSPDTHIYDGMNFNLYFSPDSYFSESMSYIIDFDNLNINNWQSVGSGKIEKDNNTEKTMISWNLSGMISNIFDQSEDTTMFRTFAVKYDYNEGEFFKFYSRESSAGGSEDPKITLFYRQLLNVNSDTVSYDTTNTSIYVSEDITIIKNDYDTKDSLNLNISLGFGERLKLSFDYSFPNGSLLKKADLVLISDKNVVSDGYLIIVDPIVNDIDTGAVDFIDDPYSTTGFPLNAVSTIEDSEIRFDMKNYFQYLILNEVENYGLKMTPIASNNPFDKTRFLFDDNQAKPRIELVYVVP